MTRPLKWALQAVCYAAFAAFVGYFSTSPSYRHLADDYALIKLSFSHPAQLVGECRDRTPEELAKLPPNMRAPRVCPRERSPVRVSITLDGRTLYEDALAPSGLSRDGPSTVYRRFPVPAGEHRILVRINDSVQVQGFNYVREETRRLDPGEVLVIDFGKDAGGIVFL